MKKGEPQTIGNGLGPAKRPSLKHVELNEGGPQGQEKQETVEFRVGVPLQKEEKNPCYKERQKTT